MAVREPVVPYLPVPRDDDYEFAVTFSLDDDWAEIRAFFEQYSFVVFRDILTPAECAATEDVIFSAVEAAAPGFDRNDVNTWSAWESNSYGMLGRDPMFDRQLLLNRQNPNVYRAFRGLSGTNEPLLVSHDRWVFYRPTDVNPSWETTKNIHLDMNPFRFVSECPEVVARRHGLCYADVHDFVTENNLMTASMGTHLQAVLNLRDNREEDGGFAVTPGFGSCFDAWAEAGARSGHVGDHGALRFAAGGNVTQRAQRVPMPAGSMVVWDQRTAHGSFPNRSDRPRLAQLLKMFPAHGNSPAQLKHRAAAVARAMAAHGFDPATDCTAIGREVFFGVDNKNNN